MEAVSNMLIKKIHAIASYYIYIQKIKMVSQTKHTNLVTSHPPDILNIFKKFKQTGYHCDLKKRTLKITYYGIVKLSC